MSTIGPAVAVLNMPGLASTLTSAGLNVMGDGLADTKSTIDLLRRVQKDNKPFIIIAAIDDPTLRSWATLHASMGAPVLVARSTIFTRGDNIPQSRIIDLPCTVNEIMTNFGATLDAEYGDVEIGGDGRIVSNAPQPPGDPFNVFGAITPQRVSELPEVTSPTSDDVLADAPASSSIFVTPPAPPSADDARGEESPSDVNIFAKNVPPHPAPEVARHDNVLDPTSIFDADLELPSSPSDAIDAEPEMLSSPTEPEPRLPIQTPTLPTPPMPARAPFPEALAGIATTPSREDRVESMFTRTRAPTPMNERRAKVVCVFAGKGGVGKSTSMLSLAERAATVVPGLRVIAVDANRGQGDVRTFLKLDDAALPSIYDATVSRNPDVFRDVLINPKRLSNSRIDRTPLHVGVILSPEKDQSDPSVVTSQVYARAIEYARTKADLVFVDTQIIESFDTSGLIDNVIVPLLLDGAWGLGLSDTSTPGVQNLMWVLNNFVERGVSTNRLMVALNGVATDSPIDAGAMAKYVDRYATWMGMAVIDPLIERTLNLGEMPGSTGVGETPEFTALLDRVLFHVTGLSAFSQISSNPPPAPVRTTSARRFTWRRR